VHALQAAVVNLEVETIDVGMLKITRKLSYRKDDRAMRPMYGCPENCRESLTIHPRLLFPKFLMGFCSDWAYKCACKIWSS